MNIGAFPLLNDSTRTSNAFSNVENMNNLFESLFQNESLALNERSSEQMKELKQHINTLKELLQSGNKEKTINLVENSQQHISVNQSNYILVNAGNVSPEDYSSYVLNLIEDMELLLSNGNEMSEELLLISQVLDELLTSIPEELEINNEQLTELTSIMNILAQIINGRQNNQNVEPLMDYMLNGNSFNGQELDEPTRSIHMTKDLEEVSKQARELIEQALTKEQTVQLSKQLTELLEQAHQHKQYSSVSNANEVLANQKNNVDEIWSNLQSMYDKRSAINKSGAYAENAKVNSADISSWLEHMVKQSNVLENQSLVHLQQQMTPVEQYVMHVRTQGGTELQTADLMEQFKQMINQSALGKNQFFKQLSITIQPEQLGEITIRLVQLEGELVAKISVTSQTAKSALESNLHQLKHLFAPHQVLIEKHDGVDQTNVEKDNPKDNQEHSSSEHEEKHHSEDHDERSFQEQFDQILEETVGER